MIFPKLYYSSAKDDFKIMNSKVSSLFLTLEAVMLVPLVKYFPWKKEPCFPTVLNLSSY